MTVKAPRALTHARRLQSAERWSEIIERGFRLLGDRAGPLLLQLPPTMERDDARLDVRARPPALPHPPGGGVPAPSWLTARCSASSSVTAPPTSSMSGAKLPCVLRATSDRVYVRWHGPEPRAPLRRLLLRGRPALVGGPSPRVGRALGHRVYGYFNNDQFGYAVANAMRLRDLLGQ